MVCLSDEQSKLTHSEGGGSHSSVLPFFTKESFRIKLHWFKKGHRVMQDRGHVYHLSQLQERSQGHAG